MRRLPAVLFGVFCLLFSACAYRPATSPEPSVEEMAGAVSYSTSHFGVLFTQKTNLTPIDYFNHLKVQRACHFLDFTDLKIKEIAYRLGFDDPYYFSKVFTRYMGMSPLAYKNSQKG